MGALLRKLNPKIKDRPWRVLCDGEIFLHSYEARAAYNRRRRDLEDYKNKKPCLGKAQYTDRVKQVLKTATAQQKAANIAAGFRSVCKEVVRKGGAAARS